jgi:hypothetical protein
MAGVPILTELVWPPLDYARDRGTFEALHMWSQIVGQIRTAQEPWLNHSWHVPLYVTARGLGTTAIPSGAEAFEMEFEFHDHSLQIATTRGIEVGIDLRSEPVSAFLGRLMATLQDLGIAVPPPYAPNEVEVATPFADDHDPRVYEPDAAHRLWRALLSIDRVFKLFRTGFLGKSSPVHFFWGSFDLAVTRFSGRRAPLHPGGVPNLPDAVAQEAYSHEVASAGFWPGGGAVDFPAFYAYAYPEPRGYGDWTIMPRAAFYHEGLKEFVLPYEEVRSAADPAATLLAFLQSSYEVAADLGHWDRRALECDFGRPGVPRPLEHL